MIATIMLNTVLLIVLAVVVIGPPIALSRRGKDMRWGMRYFLSALPALYTWSGWQLAMLAHDYWGCQGGMKVHACKVIGSFDPTRLVDYLFFLMLPFMFIAAPLSLWLLLSTGAKHIGDCLDRTKQANGPDGKGGV